MADGGLVSNSGIGPNYQSGPSTRNKGGPNIVPLTPLLQYILFWRDGVILFPEFAKFGVGVYLRNVYIENSFLEKVSIGHYCLHTDHQW